MALHKDNEFRGSDATILDLPEPIFREVFSYLDLKTVYSMKHLCLQIEEYVNGYLELGGIFMLSTGRNIPSEIIHIYKKRSKKTEIYSTLIDPYPYPRGFRATDLGSFGAKLNKTIVIGVYHGHLESFKFDLHKFHTSTNEWSLIRPGQKRDHGYSDQTDSSNRERRRLWRGGPIISSCAISDSSLILIYSGYSDPCNCAQLLQMYENKKKHRTEYSLRDIEIPQALRSLKEFTLIRISSNKFMLIGGVHCSGFLERNSSTLMWEGTLNDDGNSLSWRSIDLGVGRPRRRPICFKLQDNLYITGGHDDCFEEAQDDFCMHFEFEDGKFRQKDPTKCEECLASKSSMANRLCTCCYEYNLVDETYYKIEHTFHAGRTHRSHISNVLTDKDENFALIAPVICSDSGKHEDKNLIIFTPEEGFQELSDFDCSRGNNVEWKHPKIREHLNILVQID